SQDHSSGAAPPARETRPPTAPSTSPSAPSGAGCTPRRNDDPPGARPLTANVGVQERAIGRDCNVALGEVDALPQLPRVTRGGGIVPPLLRNILLTCIGDLT